MSQGKPLDQVRDSLWAWAKDVGKWWWAALAFVLTIVAAVALFAQVRRHAGWVVAACIAVLLVGSFIAYHRERTREKTAPAPAPGVAIGHVDHLHLTISNTGAITTQGGPTTTAATTPPPDSSFVTWLDPEPPDPNQGKLFDQDEGNP